MRTYKNPDNLVCQDFFKDCQHFFKGCQDFFKGCQDFFKDTKKSFCQDFCTSPSFTCEIFRFKKNGFLYNSRGSPNF